MRHILTGVFWLCCKLGWYHVPLPAYNQANDIVGFRCAFCQCTCEREP